MLEGDDYLAKKDSEEMCLDENVQGSPTWTDDPSKT